MAKGERLGVTTFNGEVAIGVDSPTGGLICTFERSDFPDEARAHAAFIVRACNAHDTLVKALRACLHIMDDGMDEDCPEDEPCDECRIIREGRAALAAAEGDDGKP